MVGNDINIHINLLSFLVVFFISLSVLHPQNFLPLPSFRPPRASFTQPVSTCRASLGAFCLARFVHPACFTAGIGGLTDGPILKTSCVHIATIKQLLRILQILQEEKRLRYDKVGVSIENNQICLNYSLCINMWFTTIIGSLKSKQLQFLIFQIILAL